MLLQTSFFFFSGADLFSLAGNFDNSEQSFRKLPKRAAKPLDNFVRAARKSLVLDVL